MSKDGIQIRCLVSDHLSLATKRLEQARSSEREFERSKLGVFTLTSERIEIFSTYLCTQESGWGRIHDQSRQYC